MSALLLIFISFLSTGTISHAKSCLNADIGETCTVKIRQLHPTQFNLGHFEVDARSERYSKMSDKKLKDYLDENPAPILRGPQGLIYILDHHHLARALALAGVDEMNGVLTDDLSRLSVTDFWQNLERTSRVYLEDRGVAQSAEQLPTTLAKMRDDPYRSLAWAVSNNNGYKETTVLYADFLWANFFRTRVDLRPGVERALDEATVLAHSPAAKNLPGYIP